MRYYSRRLVLLAALILGAVRPLTGGPPEVRSDAYGDPLPAGARYRLGSVRLRHDAEVVDVAWAPDGKTLVSLGRDCAIRLWRMPEGKEIRRLELNSWGACCMALSPDGRVLATAGTYSALWRNDRDNAKNGGVRLWDLATGKELLWLGSPEADVRGLAFAPDSKTVAAGGVNVVRLYDSETGKERRVLTGDAEFFYSISFSPDGKALAAAGNGLFHCWDLKTGKELPRPKGGAAHSLAFSPDGKTLAAAARVGFPEAALLLWNWPEGTERPRPPVKDLDHDTLTFSPDGKLLVVMGGAADLLLLLDTATGREVSRFPCRYPRIGSCRLAFSPDGSRLAVADGGYAVTLRDLRAGKGIRPLAGQAFRPACCGVAPDGKTLLTATLDGALDLWDARDGRHLRKLGRWERGPDELTVAADGKALAWDYVAGSDWLVDLARGDRRPLPQREDAISLSPDGAILARGTDDSIVRLHDAATGKELRRLDAGEGQGHWALAWTPDARLLAGACYRGPTVLWEVRTGRRLMQVEGREGRRPGLALSADGRLLALVWTDGALCLYETASGQQIRQFDARPGWGLALAFAPDNRTLAYGGAAAEPRQFEVRLWDVLRGTLLRSLPGRQGPARALAFLPDGALVTAGADETVLCWESSARRAPGPALPADRLARLWTDLGGKDATRALRAVADLIDSPATALPWLEKALPPVADVPPARIAALIADLDHEEFARRDGASKELAGLGELAEPALRRAVAGKPPPEARRRLMDLLEALDHKANPPELLRTLRTLQVLEANGTPDARRLLEGLAKGAPGARLTREAAASLQRLERRSAPIP